MLKGLEEVFGRGVLVETLLLEEGQQRSRIDIGTCVRIDLGAFVWECGEWGGVVRSSWGWEVHN